MLSILLVVATGVMTVITMRGSYDSLVLTQQAYYRESRFADVWAPLKRAPEALRRKIEALPGITAVDTRVSFLARLDLPGLAAPAQGRFVSLSEHGRPLVNDIHLRDGRYLAPGATDEVIISENFAVARGLRPGDQIRALLNGRAKNLSIVGIAVAAEFTYAVPPGSIYPDDEHYGVFWMSRKVLGPAYDMDGAFNEVLLRLSPAAREDAVITRLDALLEPFGGLGAYAREYQASHQILQAELDQNRIMGTAIPAIFLGVAALLLNLVLGRLIATQRGEIAVLKAFGYRNNEVGRHYLMFALAAVAGGVVVGVVGGLWLGRAYVAMYGQYFNFPDLQYQLSLPLVVIAALVSLAAASAGALSAVRRATQLPPAEAMRPEPPARFHASWLERLGVTDGLPSSVRMIVRNLERKRLQSILSSVGVAFSVAILVVGMFMFDGVTYMMDLQFRVIQRESLMLTFNERLDADVAHDLRRLDGVTRVEIFHNLPARLRFGHKEREVVIQGIEADAQLRRIVTASGNEHPLPAQGVVISALLAEKLGVATGDLLFAELLAGRRSKGPVRVAGVVDDFMGLSVYMHRSALNRLAGESDLASGAYLSVTGDKQPALNRYLKNLPAVAAVSSPALMLASFEQQLADSLNIAIGFLLGFAGVIAVGIIYNGARISLSERGRELASLRVMGFRRGETAMLLFGEQAVITLLAIPLGWLLGYGLSLALAASLQNESYRIPFVISAETYLYSALITSLAALVSAIIVRRRLDRLDLISVLKSHE